jgi:ribosomal subunit interface protein
MDVVVFGKHVEVAPRLRAHTLDKIERITKFASDVRRVDVDYALHATRRAEDSHSCEILVHVNKHLVKGHAAAVDHTTALDLALGKVEQQLRRLHDRRVHRRNGARSSARLAGAPVPEAPVAGGIEDDDRDAAPAVVRTKQIAVKPMDVEEAALQMELLGHDFFLFTTADTGRAAVLYRRRDGDLGLIEAAG